MTPFAFQEPVQESRARLLCTLREQLTSAPTLYEGLNRLRHWVNREFPEFELYLEDAWNERTEGETHFEYILRSKKTYNETPPIGYDIYRNHQDAKGVWHLDEYTRSVQLMPDLEPLVDFLFQNR